MTDGSELIFIYGIINVDKPVPEYEHDIGTDNVNWNGIHVGFIVGELPKTRLIKIYGFSLGAYY